MRLEGKTALITGASRNIGRETALTFAREGADVALSSLQSPRELEDVAAECRELGVKTYTATADIADGDQCRRLVADSLEALGKIDVLVSNAAIRPHHPLLSVSDEDWHRVFAINLHSTFYLAKAVLPGMMHRQTGSIIGIGGMAAITGRPDTSTVTAAKTGLWGFIRAIAAEFAPYNIRANMVNPGTIDTTRRNPEWFAREIPPSHRFRAADEPHPPGPAGYHLRHRQRLPLPGVRRVLLHHGRPVERSWRSLHGGRRHGLKSHLQTGTIE